MNKFIDFFKKYYNSRASIIVISFLTIIVLHFFTDLLLSSKYVCPFRYLFNIYCAGCGTTRMFLSIYKLQFYQAFRYNPLMFLYLILLIFYIIFCFFKYRKIKLPNYKVIVFLILLMFIFMILRNTETFSYLKPTKL